MGGKNPCKAINGNNIAKRKFYFLDNYNVLHCDIIFKGLLLLNKAKTTEKKQNKRTDLKPKQYVNIFYFS